MVYATVPHCVINLQHHFLKLFVKTLAIKMDSCVFCSVRLEKTSCLSVSDGVSENGLLEERLSF